MPAFLIDTDVLVDLSKKQPSAIAWFKKAFEENLELAVSPINIAEFYSGISHKERLNWDNFFEVLEYWTITKNISRQAGIWRYNFARTGTSISTQDCLIAATALAHNAILLTKNIKDYPMPGIKLLSVSKNLSI